jgi:hypothetical protein
MTMNDDEALALALRLFEKHPRWKDHVPQMRTGKPNPHGGWFISPKSDREIAEFAASVLQSENLNLFPHEYPPCDAGVDCEGKDGSLKLLAKMEAAGVSRWHPSPLEALAEAKS